MIGYVRMQQQCLAGTKCILETGLNNAQLTARNSFQSLQAVSVRPVEWPPPPVPSNMHTADAMRHATTSAQPPRPFTYCRATNKQQSKSVNWSQVKLTQA